MKIHRFKLDGLALVEPAVHGDARGWFYETWNKSRYANLGLAFDVVQANLSRSAKHVLRGLHYQWPKPQGKLVSVLEGEVWDVAVDIRPASPTFKRWIGERLDASGFRQLWIPPGFAHGFCVLSEAAQVEYKCTAYYDRDDEIGISWRDPDLAIEWPIEAPLVSAKDRDAPRLRDVEPLLERHAR